MNEATILGLPGVTWALMGAVFAVIGGGIGSAIGLSSASNAAAGIVTEDAGKFGRILPLAAMPSTQGIYGFVTGFLVMILFDIPSAAEDVALTGHGGFEIMLACLPVAAVGLITGIYQGLTSAGASGMVARRDEDAGKALIFPALVETYAVFALIITVLILFGLQGIYAG